MICLHIIEVLKAVLFGVVEGITEWLPISSTGHLIILENILDVKASYNGELWSLFLVVIQLGAILAVVTVFFYDLSPIKKDKGKRLDIYRLWLKIGVAIILSVILGLLFDDYLESKLYNAVGTATALFFYGIVFIVVEIYDKKRKAKRKEISDISFKDAFIIGLFQALSLIPGTSRSGITIIGGMLLLYSRGAAARFSFYLSIPTMLGASMLKLFKFYLAGGVLARLDIYFILIGAVTAYIVSLFVVRLLLSFVKNHDLKGFGYYRIIFGIIILLLYLNNII